MNSRLVRRRSQGFTLIELMIVIAIIAILASVLIPNFIRARAQGQLTACKSNLRNIATAIELYSTEHGGRFCQDLGQLTPNYIKSIPACPVAGVDTYSGNFVSTSLPDEYIFECNGSWHTGIGLQGGYPKYDSSSGLIERP